MKLTPRIVFIGLLTLCCTAWVQAEVPRNIILLIGDGLGVAQVTAARTVKGELAMESMPIGGLVLTHDTTHYVTDSAAGGTALATGTSTRKGRIGMASNGRRLTNLLELAAGLGKASGVVTTDKLTGATPASFLAHAKDRSETENLAGQISRSSAKVLIAGGAETFDDPDLRANLARRGPVVKTWKALRAHRLGPVTALLDEGVLALSEDRDFSLADLTEQALRLLGQEPNGFVLVIEEALTDKRGHKKDGPDVIAETISLDDAVAACLDFQRTHPHTLVLVTADHETGAVTLEEGSVEDRTATLSYHSGSHSATMVPLLAAGPGADRLGGIKTNAEVGRLLQTLLQEGAKRAPGLHRAGPTE